MQLFKCWFDLFNRFQLDHSEWRNCWFPSASESLLLWNSFLKLKCKQFNFYKFRDNFFFGKQQLILTDLFNFECISIFSIVWNRIIRCEFCLSLSTFPYIHINLHSSILLYVLMKKRYKSIQSLIDINTFKIPVEQKKRGSISRSADREKKDTVWVHITLQIYFCLVLFLFFHNVSAILKNFGTNENSFCFLSQRSC